MLSRQLIFRLRNQRLLVVEGPAGAALVCRPAAGRANEPDRSLVAAIVSDPENSAALTALLEDFAASPPDASRRSLSQEQMVDQVCALLASERISFIPFIALPLLPPPDPGGGSASPSAQIPVAQMSLEQKMEKAIGYAPFEKETLRELGALFDPRTLVPTLLATFLALELIAATGFGALVEGAALCLLLAGAAISGAQITKGLQRLLEFYRQLKGAASDEDLRAAGKTFANAMVDLGVGGLMLLMSALGLRARVARPASRAGAGGEAPEVVPPVAGNPTPRNSPLLQRYLSGSGGRWGGATTRAQNDRIATDLEARGYRISGGAGRASEEWIPGPGGGTRGGTFVDITATDGTSTVRVQTVTTLADGVTPTPEEAAAAARIRAAFPNDQLIIVPK